MDLLVLAAAVALLGSPRELPPPALAVIPDQVVINDTAAVELKVAIGDPRDALFMVEAGRVEPLPNETGRARARWLLPSELTPRRLAE